MVYTIVAHISVSVLGGQARSLFFAAFYLQKLYPIRILPSP
jgi:hypothetical protein